MTRPPPGEGPDDPVDDLRRQLRVARHAGALYAHELGNAVFAVRARTELLLHRWEHLDGDERRRQVALVDDQVAHLEQLLAGLVRLTRLEAEDQRPPNGAPDLAAVLDEAVAAALPGSAAPGDVAIDCPAQIRSPVSPSLVSLIARNLVQNALRYGRPPVVVTVPPPADVIELRVADAGDGTADDLRHRMLRLRSSDEPSTHGLGFGLALVHDLVALHDGRMSVEERDPTGVTVVVRLPTA